MVYLTQGNIGVCFIQGYKAKFQKGIHRGIFYPRIYFVQGIKGVY